MKTFQEFMLIAESTYDASFMSGAQVRKTGEGGRVGAERKKTAPERRRTKRVGGGQTVPAKEYKPRSDIGVDRPRSEREQQPERERGTSTLSAKQAQRKAYLERKARERSQASAPAATERELEKAGDELLKKKKAPQREKQVKTVKGDYTRAEKAQLKRSGRKTLRDIVLSATGKKKESQLKNKYTGTGDERGQG